MVELVMAKMVVVVMVVVVGVVGVGVVVAVRVVLLLTRDLRLRLLQMVVEGAEVEVRRSRP